MLMQEAQLDTILSETLIEDLFGIGDRLASRLNAVGILTARTLKSADHAWLRSLAGVGVQRVALELRGISCLPLQLKAKPRQAMMVSQSFGRPVEQLEELLEVIAHYSVRAAEKLRRHHQQAGSLAVFIRTNPFDKKAPQYGNSAETRFMLPTAYTPDLIRTSQELVRQIYQGGYRYKKAGVYLSSLHAEEVIQPDLFGAFSWEEEARRARLMATVDLINDHFGRDTVFWSAQGMTRDWQMRQRRRSPHYTTRWQDILPVT